MPKINRDGVNIYYEVHGSGEPLLMIMGLGSSSATWSPALVAELSRRFQTIVYDNRGTGQSDKPAIPYSLEMFASDHYEDISLAEWMSHTPHQLIDQHLHVGREMIDAIPKDEMVII